MNVLGGIANNNQTNYMSKNSVGYHYLVLGEKCIRKMFIPVSLENCIFLAVRKAVTKEEMARHCRWQTRGVEETSNCYG